LTAVSMPSRFTSTGPPLRIITSSAQFLSLLSSERGLAVLLVELGVVGLFAAGIAAPWCLLLVVLLGWAVRAVDLETSALFIVGGLYGAAKEAFGRPTARVAASALLVEYVLFGAL